MKRRVVCLVVFWGVSVIRAYPAEPAPGQFDGLVKNSPFGQTAVTGAPGGNEASPLEFRGVFLDKGKYFFSLHETASRSGQRVGLKESGQPYFVESYDSAQGSIQVKYRNQMMPLTLKRAQIVVQAPPPLQPSTGSTVGGNPAPTDEASRLALVAEEIRRRRALRAPGGLPRQNAAGNPSLSGPIPPQTNPGNSRGPGPVPQQNTTGNSGPGPQPINPGSHGPGPMPQQNNTGNPPPPGPLPTNP